MMTTDAFFSAGRDEATIGDSPAFEAAGLGAGRKPPESFGRMGTAVGVGCAADTCAMRMKTINVLPSQGRVSAFWRLLWPMDCVGSSPHAYLCIRL